jgi:hypothetical protein
MPIFYFWVNGVEKNFFLISYCLMFDAKPSMDEKT